MCTVSVQSGEGRIRSVVKFSVGIDRPGDTLDSREGVRRRRPIEQDGRPFINLEWANTAEVEEAEVEETKKEASKE